MNECISFSQEHSDDPQRVLEHTGMLGVPTDIEGKMVGTSDYRAARGPVAVPPTTLKGMLKLQDLIDRGEACYPGNKKAAANGHKKML